MTNRTVDIYQHCAPAATSVWGRWQERISTSGFWRGGGGEARRAWAQLKIHPSIFCLTHTHDAPLHGTKTKATLPANLEWKAGGRGIEVDIEKESKRGSSTPGGGGIKATGGRGWRNRWGWRRGWRAQSYIEKKESYEECRTEKNADVDRGREPLINKDE